MHGEEPESFEVTEYSNSDLTKVERLTIIKQVVENRRFDDEFSLPPSVGIQVHIQGDQMKLVYNCYEMFLNDHQRLREVERQADKILGDSLKYLKKKYKAEAKEALSPKELKELRNYSIQKVSLNERYVFSSWRVYSLELE